MPALSVRAVKMNLSRLVDRAAAGEETIIVKAGKPVARLTALATAEGRPKRRLGGLPGRATIPPEFDAVLPEETFDAFEGR